MYDMNGKLYSNINNVDTKTVSCGKEVFMKKWQIIDYILAGIAVLAILIYLGILFFTGKSVTPMLTFFLYAVAGVCTQVLFLHVSKWKGLKVLPLATAILIAVWGIWLYCTSPDWKNADMEDLIVDYISPMIGCLLAVSTYKMNKWLALWTALSAVVMLVLPGLAVNFIKSDAGMAVCFLLFFGVNPIYSILAGVFAGRRMNAMWGLPIITAVLFLLGAWIFFDMGEQAFILYGTVYLVLGVIALLVSFFRTKKGKDDGGTP